MNDSVLFEPIQLGPCELPARIFKAATSETRAVKARTRRRSDPVTRGVSRGDDRLSSVHANKPDSRPQQRLAGRILYPRVNASPR
jgi:hypothetical protein